MIFDDTLQDKPYTGENEWVCWRFDHIQGRPVQGVNILNCLYHSGGVHALEGMSLPVAFELVRKPHLYSDLSTRQVKRKSDGTKNELLRRMLKACLQNPLKYRYVLADSCFSAQENLTFVRQDLGPAGQDARRPRLPVHLCRVPAGAPFNQAQAQPLRVQGQAVFESQPLGF